MLSRCVLSVGGSWVCRLLVAGSVGSVPAVAWSQAYFSLTGDFNTAGDQLDFLLDVNWNNVSSADELGFQTFANAGGTNRAGDTIAAGGIDSVIELLNPFVSGSFGINDDFDSGNNGFDSLLTWPGSTPSPGGANVPLDDNNLPPGGGDFLRLATFNNTGTGPWAIDLFGPADHFELQDIFDSNLSSDTSTIDTLKFGTTTGGGTATVTLRTDHTFLGDVVVGQSGRARLNIVPFTPSNNSRTVTVGGVLRVNTADRVELSGNTLQANGGVVVSGGIFNQTGGTLALGNGETFNVSGNGAATFSTGLIIDNDETFSGTTGGDLTVTGMVRVGDNGQAGTLTVDSAAIESNLNISGGITHVGSNGSTGTLNIRRDANATTGTLFVARDANAANVGTVNVEDGGDLTAFAFAVGRENGDAGTGTINIDGTGSTLTVANTLNAIGNAAGDGTHAVNVTNGGTLNAGTGDLNINASGTLTVDATSNYDINGNINVDGGTLDLDTIPTFFMASGKSLTAANDGRVQTDGTLFLFNNQTLNVNSGADMDHAGDLIVGTNNGNGTANISGAGSTLDLVGSLELTLSGNAGTVNVINDATVNVSGSNGLFLARSGTNATTDADLNVNSGGDVTTNFLGIGNVDGNAGTGTVTVAGNGSNFTITGTGNATIGNADTPNNQGVHRVDVTDDATFTTGTGTTNVRKTGSINVSGNATWNQNGDLNVEAGVFQLTSGSFSLADGKDINVTNGGRFDYQNGGIPGSLVLDSTGSVVTVSGTDSRFNSLSAGDGFLTIENGVAVNVGDGAILDTDNLFLNEGAVTIDGAGSRLVATSGNDTVGFNFHQVGFGTDATLTLRNGATGNLRLGAGSSVVVGQFATNSLINVESGATLQLDGLLIDNGTVTVTGTNSAITQSAGSTLNVGNFGPTPSATLIIENGGAFNATAGSDKTIRPAGVVNVKAGGQLNLGSSTLDNQGILRGNGQIIGDIENAGSLIPDTDLTAGFNALSIEGQYTQTTDGSLEITRAPGGGALPTPLYLDLLVVTQGLDLAGNLAFIDGPTDGGFAAIPTYEEGLLIDVTSLVPLTSSFETVNGHILGDGTAIAVLYGGQDVVYQRALFGDANLNQQIEQGDLDAVLNNWGATGRSWATGDYNGNGTVEQADLDAVLNNWGSATPPNLRGFAVPEPAALATLLAGVALAQRRRIEGRDH